MKKWIVVMSLWMLIPAMISLWITFRPKEFVTCRVDHDTGYQISNHVDAKSIPEFIKWTNKAFGDTARINCYAEEKR
jgi:hypothetical protein